MKHARIYDPSFITKNTLFNLPGRDKITVRYFFSRTSEISVCFPCKFINCNFSLIQIHIFSKNWYPEIRNLRRKEHSILDEQSSR